MSLDSPGDTTAPVDPFGLWSPAPVNVPLSGGMVSFGLPASGGAGEPEAPAAVWRLDLTSGPEGQVAAQQELERRAGQVQSIFTGLEQAVPRSQALLTGRARAASQGLSFDVSSPGEPLAEPEARFSDLLNQVETVTIERPSNEVSFGLGQDLANLAGNIKDKLTGTEALPAAETLPIPGWEEMQRNFEQLMDTVNRQLLHFCWVDTSVDGLLAARTTVDWGGDMVSLWKTDLLPEQAAAHRRSLELAMQSRAANIKTVMTVAEVAGRLTLLVTTPLGPLQAAQALVLGWKFVSSVVMPLLKQA